MSVHCKQLFVRDLKANGYVCFVVKNKHAKYGLSVHIYVCVYMCVHRLVCAIHSIFFLFLLLFGENTHKTHTYIQSRSLFRSRDE